MNRGSAMDDRKMAEDDGIFSVLRKDLSVITPTIDQTYKSRSKSYAKTGLSSKNFHMANPNPQPGASYKFKGIRDLGYNKADMQSTTLPKFGKRVY